MGPVYSFSDLWKQLIAFFIWGIREKGAECKFTLHRLIFIRTFKRTLRTAESERNQITVDFILIRNCRKIRLLHKLSIIHGEIYSWHNYTHLQYTSTFAFLMFVYLFSLPQMGTHDTWKRVASGTLHCLFVFRCLILSLLFFIVPLSSISICIDFHHFTVGRDTQLIKANKNTSPA